MGTFHHDKSELHGITVVVDTRGPKVLVGRCDDMDDEQVILLDVDVHEEGQNGRTKAQYIERAAKFGVWKKHDRVVVPRADVVSVRRLGEVLSSGAKAPAVAPSSSQQGTSAPAIPLTPSSRPSTGGPAVQDAAKASSSAGTAVAVAAPAIAAPVHEAEHVVTLTPSAQVEVLRLIEAEGKPGIGLRLGVSGGGCSGLSYKLEFDLKKEGDLAVSYPGFQVYLDRKSTIYLRGITLDHQKGLSGKGFVFHNPNATNTCGCGESFSV